MSAIGFSGAASVTYRFDSDLKDYFIFVGWKNDAYKAVAVSLSKDGKTFTNAAQKLIDYGDANGQHFGRVEQFPVPAGYRYLKISVENRSGLSDLEISRVEINLK